ncbi:hypothetical protein BGZ72_002899, partial [Mortierella alpina]
MRKSHHSDGIDKDLSQSNVESVEEDKNNDNKDNGDNNDNDNSNSDNNNNNNPDANKAGDDIQLRDIIASLDYLTNRFEQQHGNQGEEAMFNSEDMDELYEDDPNYPHYPDEDMDPYSSSVLELEYEGGDYDPYEYDYHPPPPPPIINNSFPTNAYISPPLPNANQQQHEHEYNPYFNKSTIEPSEYQHQNPATLNKALREAPSPSPDSQLRLKGARNPQNHSSTASPSLDGLLKPQAARNPQHHSTSIPTVAVQQWQCAQQGQDPQYIPPPSSVLSKPSPKPYSRNDPQDDYGGYHDRTDRQAFYHDQRRNDPQEDRDRHKHGVDYSA